MNLSDIIALAKQGYTPGDIRELLKIAQEEKTPEPSGDVSPEQEPAPPTETEPKSTPTEEAEKAETETDDKDEKIKELEAKLKQAQDANTRQKRPEETPPKSDAEILEDMARRFM